MKYTQNFILLALLALVTTPLHARTIVLTMDDCDRGAAIDESAPLFSWAMVSVSDNAVGTDIVQLVPRRRLLLRFALDKIPPGHRIEHAELITRVHYRQGPEPRLYLWRMLADWGPGVCHQYRMTKPEKLEWTKPGAGGNSSDRATEPTDIVRVKAAVIDEHQPIVINVTEDVDLWYRGVARNNGWMFSVEYPGVDVRLASPLNQEGRVIWKLRITYEPAAE